MTAAMEGEPSHKAADVLYAHLLDAMGLASDVDDRTATRYVRSLRQLTYGIRVDPTRHLQVTFPPVTTQPTLVTVANVPYVSLCAHHMMPFWGTATIAYLPQPGAKIVGLSKIARCFRELGARPQIQEQLGQQMIDAIVTNLGCDGAAVAIAGTHTCMALRGASTGTETAMVTTAMTGALERDPWLGQFLTVAQTVMQR
jgi:GTP cyclohydrolase I